MGINKRLQATCVDANYRRFPSWNVLFEWLLQPELRHQLPLPLSHFFGGDFLGAPSL
jgi:hypothetical protein